MAVDWVGLTFDSSIDIRRKTLCTFRLSLAKEKAGTKKEEL